MIILMMNLALMSLRNLIISLITLPMKPKSNCKSWETSYMIKTSMMMQLLLIWVHMNLKVDQSMKVNGKEDRNMEKANKYGRMERSMKVAIIINIIMIISTMIY